MSVAAYATEWIEQYQGRTARGIDDSTRADYRRSLELHVLPLIGSRTIAGVSARHVRDLVRHLEQRGQAPSSIRKHMAPLKALLATAVEDELVPTNAAAVVRIAGRRNDWERREPRVLTSDELAAFFAVVPVAWALFFRLLLHTGVRVSEAIGLVWEDVALGAEPELRIRRQVCRGRVKPPKTRYGRREIPLSPRMADALSRWQRANRAGDTQPIFASASKGFLDVSNVRARVLRPTARRAALENVGFHAFRHTCASLLFKAGKDLKQIQHWLGHHDPAFTLSTYVHLLDAGLGDARFFDDVA